ncbi:MAG: hypothetical protein WA584_08845 [Pyrinomonadaceae bacterium]
MKKIVLFFILIAFCAAAKAQSVEVVKALNTPSLEGKTISVFYSSNYRERATNLQAALEKSNAYFKKKLGIEIKPLYLTVFDAVDYKKLRAAQPYGLPFATGNPPVVFLPATSDGIVAAQSRPLLEKLPPETSLEIKELGYDINSAIDKSVDSIGFHELGHIYSLKLGIQPKMQEVFWMKEFTATYLAYAYMMKNEPKSARLWRLLSGAIVNSWKPAEPSLREMGKVSITNPQAYSWYQAKIVLKAAEVYEKQQLKFIKHLKKFAESKDKPTEDEVLSELAKTISDVRSW